MRRISGWPALLALGLAACAATPPENPYDLAGPDGYMIERASMTTIPGSVTAPAVGAWNAKRCAAPATAAPQAPAARLAAAPALSPGDMVRITLPNGDPPSGNYEIGTDGRIALPLLGNLALAGKQPVDGEAALAQMLVERGFYREGFARVSIQLLDQAPARILVAGAVFQPGLVNIGGSGQDRDPNRTVAAGDRPLGRLLSVALAHAGGVRPDADLAHIVVIHDGQRVTTDLSGLLSGTGNGDLYLTEGDRVEVASLHCFQEALARPSDITPVGVRVYISNLTQPASANAQSAINKESTSFPYGTRLLQAAVSGNCVGGTQATNADRRAVLITSNPETGTSEVIDRPIEGLVRRADRDAYNPVLLPGDAVACYDSPVTNFRDVVKTISEMFVPALAFKTFLLF
ncbi:MAG: polysaccharide biosynthesis/export family protein [Dongiaceae bacterium]